MRSRGDGKVPKVGPTWPCHRATPAPWGQRFSWWAQEFQRKCCHRTQQEGWQPPAHPCHTSQASCFSWSRESRRNPWFRSQALGPAVLAAYPSSTAHLLSQLWAFSPLWTSVSSASHVRQSCRPGPGSCLVPRAQPTWGSGSVSDSSCPQFPPSHTSTGFHFTPQILCASNTKLDVHSSTSIYTWPLCLRPYSPFSLECNLLWMFSFFALIFFIFWGFIILKLVEWIRCPSTLLCNSLSIFILSTMLFF